MTNSMTCKPFTVIGFDPDSYQIVCVHVLAADGLQAFTAAAHQYEDCGLEFVSAHPGHLHEDTDVFFPGEGLVDGETVLAQPEVFGAFSPEATTVD